MSPTGAKKTAIPQQEMTGRRGRALGAPHVLAFVFFGAIVALAIPKERLYSESLLADAGARSSKRSGRHQEMWRWNDAFVR
jgi:hypothetical protein